MAHLADRGIKHRGPIVGGDQTGWLGLELKLPPPPPEEVRHLTSPDQVEATTARSRKAAEKLTRASWRSGGAVGTEE